MVKGAMELRAGMACEQEKKSLQLHPKAKSSMEGVWGAAYAAH